MSSGCIKPELNLTSPGQGCWGIAVLYTLEDCQFGQTMILEAQGLC
jgi:hypothetical protein